MTLMLDLGVPSHNDDLLDLFNGDLCPDLPLLADLDLDPVDPTLSTPEVVKSEPAAVLSDCMWSSALNFLDSVRGQNGRNRQDSLTLSECAESLFKDIKDIDSVLGPVNEIYTNEVEEEEDEEEIDVVSDDSSSSTVCSTPTRTVHPGQSLLQKRPRSTYPVQPGRSILRSNVNRQQQQQQRQQQQTVIDGDHCYFSVRQQQQQQPGVSEKSSRTGLLTPTDSSDEDDVVCKRTRKQVNNVKFKFRMKFKSHKQEEDRKKAKEQQQRQAAKRKTAIENTHCPSPVKKAKKVNNNNQSKTPQQSPRYVQQVQQDQLAEQKSREIRDLHNSMERQRRVDLRNNFDQLKDMVPELRDVEKASKLNILNKAADYCQQLSHEDSALSRAKEQGKQRNAILHKRLAALMASFGTDNKKSAIRVANSGRISVVSSRHSGRVY